MLIMKQTIEIKHLVKINECIFNLHHPKILYNSLL